MDGAEQVHMIKDLLQENIGREFQSRLCVSVGSAIGFFRVLSDWGLWCLRASGKVDSGM